MKRPRTHVTDHALLRYLERVEGLNVEALRRRIGQAVDRLAVPGASGVQIDGHSYRLEHAPTGAPIVTTVVHQNRADPRHGPARRRARER